METQHESAVDHQSLLPQLSGTGRAAETPAYEPTEIEALLDGWLLLIIISLKNWKPQPSINGISQPHVWDAQT